MLATWFSFHYTRLHGVSSGGAYYACFCISCMIMIFSWHMFSHSVVLAMRFSLCYWIHGYTFCVIYWHWYDTGSTSASNAPPCLICKASHFAFVMLSSLWMQMFSSCKYSFICFVNSCSSKLWWRQMLFLPWLWVHWRASIVLWQFAYVATFNCLSLGMVVGGHVCRHANRQLLSRDQCLFLICSGHDEHPCQQYHPLEEHLVLAHPVQ